MAGWKETIGKKEVDIEKIEKKLDAIPDVKPKQDEDEQPKEEPKKQLSKKEIVKLEKLEAKRKKMEAKANKGKKKTRYVYDVTGIISGLFLAVVLFLLFETYIFWGDPAFYIIVLIVGMCSWLVIGIPIGAFIVDTYLRCKVLRFFIKKNFGIIHIVSKGHRIITLIKDLDESIIMKGEAIWGISQGYVFNLNKKDVKHPITDDLIHYISNIPVIYLDYETMKPLSFHSETTTISPKQLGSSLVGWAMVQKKKAIRRQKAINYMYIIIASLVVVNMVFLILIFNKMGGFQ